MKIWNALPDSVINADSVNGFKNNLDRHWKNETLFYDCDAEIGAL